MLKTHISTTLGSLSVNKEGNVYAVPAYFTDETQRYYGVVTFELINNQTVITNEFKNNDNNLIYQGNCIIVGDYLYSFNINDSAPDKNKLNVFPININREHTVNRKFNKNNSSIIKLKRAGHTTCSQT